MSFLSTISLQTEEGEMISIYIYFFYCGLPEVWTWCKQLYVNIEPEAYTLSKKKKVNTFSSSDFSFKTVIKYNELYIKLK